MNCERWGFGEQFPTKKWCNGLDHIFLALSENALVSSEKRAMIPSRCQRNSLYMWLPMQQSIDSGTDLTLMGHLHQWSLSLLLSWSLPHAFTSNSSFAKKVAQESCASGSLFLISSRRQRSTALGSVVVVNNACNNA